MGRRAAVAGRPRRRRGAGSTRPTPQTPPIVRDDDPASGSRGPWRREGDRRPTSRPVPGCSRPRRASRRRRRSSPGWRRGWKAAARRGPGRAGRAARRGSGTGRPDAGRRPDPARGPARRARRRSRRAVERVDDPRRPIADRIGADRAARPARPARDRCPSCSTSSTRDASPAIQLAARRRSGATPTPRSPRALLARYPKLAARPPRPGPRACSAPPGLGRPAARRAVERRRSTPQDLTAAAGAPDRPARRPGADRAALETVWGRVPGPGSPEKVRRIAEVRGFLPEGDKGNAARGPAVFKEHCAVCHKLFDEGESIGPDLTGSERGNLDFLLTSLVDPSALVRKEYQAQTVALDDGRVLTGLIVEETDQDAHPGRRQPPEDRHRPATRSRTIKPSAVSLMPEGLLDKLPEDQVRDLFQYLLRVHRPPGEEP